MIKKKNYGIFGIYLGRLNNIFWIFWGCFGDFFVIYWDIFGISGTFLGILFAIFVGNISTLAHCYSLRKGKKKINLKQC